MASIPFRKPVCRTASLILVACAAGAALVLWAGRSAAESAPAVSDTALAADGVQVITSTLSPGVYPNITVEAGTPVRWIIDAPEGSINGCNYKMLVQEYGITHTFEEGENVIEFTPTEAGTVSYSCWMGMIRGNITIVEADGTAAG